MKIAYIAHPVAGDVEGNIQKILEIVREINLNEPDIVPFVPYLSDIQAMKDEVPSERMRGLANNQVYFSRRIIDELRLYGSNISGGMILESLMAQDNNITVKDFTR